MNVTNQTTRHSGIWNYQHTENAVLVSQTTTANMTETTKYDPAPNRIVDLVIVLFLISVSFYLVIITIVYYLKYAERNLRWTNFLCCISAMEILFESSWFLLEVRLVVSTNEFCAVYSTVNVCLATSNRTAIYIVFWFRQRSFYRGFLKHSSKKKRLNLMSNSLLVAIVVFGLIQIFTLSFIPIYASPHGCQIGKSSDFLQIFAPAVFFIIALFQVLLLIPVLYPVAKHISATRKGDPNGKLEAVIIRLCICTSICLVTDVVFLAVSVNQPAGVSFSFIPICYAVNTVVNVVSMLVSFADYKLRLLSLWHLLKSSSRRITVYCM